MQSMYNLIYFRTEANINDGMQYEHVNVQPNPWDTYYTEFFGEWTFGSVNCGVLYKMETARQTARLIMESIQLHWNRPGKM